MVLSRRISLLLVGGCLALSVLAESARAEGPATVTVRVEGLSETKLPLTTVTTTTVPVDIDGKAEDTCSGTSALGALQLATKGDWGGPWYTGLGYDIETINGETHGYEEGNLSYYWSFWLNDRESSLGACSAQLEAGDQVLFFPVCDELCPSAPAPTPLGIEAPSTATAGEPVNVIVKQYNAAGEASPVSGAAITWSGGSATTGPQGDASLTFSAGDNYLLDVTAANAVRTEATICVEGTGFACVKSSTISPKGSSETPGSSKTTSGAGAQAIAASLLGLSEGHVYSAGRAPRALRGLVSDGGASTEAVRLRLTRRFRTLAGRVHCSYYDGTTDAFRAMRCGAQHGQYFTVGSHANFSYLLPAALAPGRYVLDLEATNGSREHTTLARGSTRFVFYVR
jgi:hypothetical protein